MDILQQAIKSSQALSDFIGENLGERAEGIKVQQVVAMALLSICLDHREATLLLVSAGAYSSSRVLARSALEAYVTAEWFELLADEHQARAFMRSERQAPKFETMVQRLRKVHPWGELFEKLRAHYGTLSDYAHGQTRQVSRWIGADGVAPTHSAEEMAEVLYYVDMLGMLACVRREAISARPVEPFTAMFDRVLRRAY